MKRCRFAPAFRRLVGSLVLVGACVVAVFASPALAAFPGANGVLAVQPRSGGGIVLVSADGRGAHRICTVRGVCGIPRRPRWSADGRALVFAGPRIQIVYPDGSCMNCKFGAAPNPAFVPGGAVISFIQNGRVTLDGIDGIRQGSPPAGAASDAVWSGGNLLAVVSEGGISAGRPGHLRWIGPGTEPSWSPDGSQIAAAAGGWVVILGVGHRGVRYLVRGSAPAFSPDGRSIAFIAPGGRLMVVAARGPHPSPKPVGTVRAVSVDWQPQPAGPNPGCVAPPGSRTLASSSEAVVTGREDTSGASAYLGCLRSEGKERLLLSLPATGGMGPSEVVTEAAVGAPYAGLVDDLQDPRYNGDTSTVLMFDLRTGAEQPKLGGENGGCPDPSDECYFTGLDQLVVGSNGVSAAHIASVYPVGYLLHSFSPLACTPTGSACFGLGSRLFTSHNPAGGAVAWTTLPLDAHGDVAALACPSASLCIAFGYVNDNPSVFTTSDPAGGASTWTTAPFLLFFGVLPGTVTCPSNTLCVATSGGSIAVSTNPSTASAWRVAQIDGNNGLGPALCTTSWCAITDESGTVFASSNPTGGASAWTVSHTTPAFKSGSCPTQTLCVALADNPERILATTNPVAGPWTATPIADTLSSVSCPSASLCVAVGANGALYTSAGPASGAWTKTTIDNGFGLTSIVCPSTSLCVAGDSTGNVITATNPTGGSASWTPARIEGDPCNVDTPCSDEEIQASDGAGLHTIDSGTFAGSGPSLTGLKLTGDTLSWNHAGTPRTMTLTP